jgi:hypothetical protein
LVPLGSGPSAFTAAARPFSGPLARGEFEDEPRAVDRVERERDDFAAFAREQDLTLLVDAVQRPAQDALATDGVFTLIRTSCPAKRS